MKDQLSEGYSPNPLIIEHLITLQSTQEIFMKTKSSAKLRNTLNKTQHTREHFHLGQAVYYTLNNDIKCPDKIVGQDGSVVFIRH